jgi:hypothetical protein
MLVHNYNYIQTYFKDVIHYLMPEAKFMVVSQIGI